MKMAEVKFKKGDWVVRVGGIPKYVDCAEIGEMRKVDEESSRFPYVTHISHGNRDVIDQDEYRLATPEELGAREVTKKFDISQVKVGWTVQLNSVAWYVPRSQFQGMWGKVETIHGPTLTVLLDGNMRVHFPAVDRFILDARPPEPAKDPFALREWVVCVRFGPWWMPGEIVQSAGEVRFHPEYFASGDRVYLKSDFRPATPEEIAAHLEKNAMAGKPVIPCDADPKPLTSEDCELKIAPAAPFDVNAQDDGKITFTVAGREFFVGQRVYANTKGAAGLGKLIDVPHEVTGCVAMAELVCIREMDGFNQRVIAASCLSEAPLHEWQFGDQASHPKHGKVLVIDVADLEGLQCASPSDPEIYIDPAELTFIRRTDLGA